MNIIKILKDYNKIKADVELYRSSIDILNSHLENFDEEGEVLQAQILSDMPLMFGGNSSKTEKTAIKREDIQGKIKWLEMKLKCDLQKIQYVDNRLECLSDKHKYIIINHYIKKHPRRYILAGLIKEYGYFISERHYYNMKDNATKELMK